MIEDSCTKQLKKEIELNPNILDELFLREGQLVAFRSEHLIKLKGVLQNYKEVIEDLRIRVNDLEKQVKELK